ncbi:hypothetical protein K402DRAFT_466644 [Aulographum hederae CBS 113979]|uniref:MYND-type domain-containing protein n=1 Tax=Aulographum hederae CBS 113979 TaxID=1176131 RepID=A0A6G1GNJ8_9PEZI|nr:hypothetical protein K402DRAFT_466644 [Aulographum hederae CBS 113979]
MSTDDEDVELFEKGENEAILHMLDREADFDKIFDAHPDLDLDEDDISLLCPEREDLVREHLDAGTLIWMTAEHLQQWEEARKSRAAYEIDFEGCTLMILGYLAIDLKCQVPESLIKFMENNIDNLALDLGPTARYQLRRRYNDFKVSRSGRTLEWVVRRDGVVVDTKGQLSIINYINKAPGSFAGITKRSNKKTANEKKKKTRGGKICMWAHKQRPVEYVYIPKSRSSGWFRKITCANCKVQGNSSDWGCIHCTRCYKRDYCSLKCKDAHWKNSHQKACRPPRNLMARGLARMY